MHNYIVLNIFFHVKSQSCIVKILLIVGSEESPKLQGPLNQHQNHHPLSQLL